MAKISNAYKIARNRRTNMKLAQIVHFTDTNPRKKIWSGLIIDDVTMTWSVFYKCVIYRPDFKM